MKDIKLLKQLLLNFNQNCYEGVVIQPRIGTTEGQVISNFS